MMPGMYNVDVQLVQTKQYFAIVNEMIHDTRIVPLDGWPHGTIPQWFGDSRGHWEGATMVVETVNQGAVPGVRSKSDSDRAVHSHRREHDRIPVHDGRSVRVDATVDGRLPLRRTDPGSSNTRVTRATSAAWSAR